MVDLDNDPTKLIEVVEIGKQLLMTRGTLTTFSHRQRRGQVLRHRAGPVHGGHPRAGGPKHHGVEVAAVGHPERRHFQRPHHPALVPLALKGVAYQAVGASALLRRNLLIYGLGGVVVPFIGIKVIDLIVGAFL